MPHTANDRAGENRFRTDRSSATASAQRPTDPMLPDLRVQRKEVCKQQGQPQKEPHGDLRNKPMTAPKHKQQQECTKHRFQDRMIRLIGAAEPGPQTAFHVEKSKGRSPAAKKFPRKMVFKSRKAPRAESWPDRQRPKAQGQRRKQCGSGQEDSADVAQPADRVLRRRKERHRSQSSQMQSSPFIR